MTAARELLDDPEYCRSRAEEVRAIAAQMTDPDAKAVMLAIAKDYEKLAVRVEQPHSFEEHDRKSTMTSSVVQANPVQAAISSDVQAQNPIQNAISPDMQTRATIQKLKRERDQQLMLARSWVLLFSVLSAIGVGLGLMAQLHLDLFVAAVLGIVAGVLVSRILAFCVGLVLGRRAARKLKADLRKTMSGPNKLA